MRVLQLVSLTRQTLLILIPICLSVYTHLWNAAGFPDIFYDEGAYLRRAFYILYFQDPQESTTYYDHPYFGQIVLAGLLAITGYPDTVNPSPWIESIELLYLVPKIWMGLLAVLDTFLIYKIVQTRYENQKIAMFAALLFAVMPMTWLTRRILLESLLLPFMSSAILFALQTRTTEGNKQRAFLLVSGVCAGLAIFTKVSALAVIPVVGFLIYFASPRKSLKNLSAWLLPAVLIPLLWPAYSISEGHLDYWVNSLLLQTQRDSDGIATIFSAFMKIDPVILALGIIGFGYCGIVKRDYFPILWAGPFLILFSSIAYVQYFHVIPIIPAFCVASALWLSDIARRAKWFRRNLIENCTMAAVGVFGFVVTTMVITTDMTGAQFEAATFVFSVADQDTTIIANPAYSWVYNFVLHMPYALTDYRDVLYSPIPTNKIVLISEPHFQANAAEATELAEIYNRTSSVRTFQGEIRNYDTDSYPYTSLSLTAQGELVDVRRLATD